MDDITNRLSQLSHQLNHPTPEKIIGEDLARGRAALKRKRIRVAAFTSGAAACALVAVAVTGVSVSSFAPGTQELAGPTNTGPASGAAQTIKLVSYTGKQPEGFIVKEVPEGFTTLCSNTRAVILTADNNTTKCDYLPDYVNNLVIMRGKSISINDDKQDVENVIINGNKAVIATGKPFDVEWETPDGRQSHHQDGGTRTVMFTDAHSNEVSIQAWNNIPLSTEQLVQFAEGITVTPDAAPAPRGG